MTFEEMLKLEKVRERLIQEFRDIDAKVNELQRQLDDYKQDLEYTYLDYCDVCDRLARFWKEQIQ